MARIKRMRVVLSLPEPTPELLLFGRHIVLMMTNNAYFPAVALAGVTLHLDELEDAEATARGGAAGTAAERDLKHKAVVDDLEGLQAIVQAAVNQNMADGAAIIASSGMHQKKYTRAVKAHLAARMGATPGQIMLTAKAVARRGASYEWQYSMDGGATWIPIGTSTEARTSVHGLTPGSTYLFRFRGTIKQTTGAWSQMIRFIAH